MQRDVLLLQSSAREWALGCVRPRDGKGEITQPRAHCFAELRIRRMDRYACLIKAVKSIICVHPTCPNPKLLPSESTPLFVPEKSSSRQSSLNIQQYFPTQAAPLHLRKKEEGMRFLPSPTHSLDDHCVVQFPNYMGACLLLPLSLRISSPLVLV